MSSAWEHGAPTPPRANEQGNEDQDESTTYTKDPIRWGYGKINAKKGLDYIQQASGINVALNDKERMTDGKWYTLDGRRLAVKPNIKGVYIHGDRKVVIIKN